MVFHLHFLSWFSTIWWFSRKCYTRSLFELDGETLQRRWYCVLRPGRVGHCQIIEAQLENFKADNEIEDQKNPAPRRVFLFCVRSTF